MTVDMFQMAEKLLRNAKTELYLSMRFMGPALMSLGTAADLSTRTMGTDAKDLRYHPFWVMQTYLQHPYVLNRAYLHTVLHCIFRHMYGAEHRRDRELWDLSCDIAAESVIDEMDYASVHRTPSDFREEWYVRLSKELIVLTAEKLYRYFSENPLPYSLQARLADEFRADDHVFWDRMKEQEKPGQRPGEGSFPSEEDWKKTAKRVQGELERGAGRAGREAGDLTRVLGFDLRERLRYRDLLKKFTVVREECRVDPDSFDYGFYNYGLELFGNMPLIEENEFVEADRIRELVIAIDTSASVDDAAVRRFLTETASVLLQKDRFFRHFELHIAECDAQVRSVLVVKDAEEMERYAERIEMHGGGGTDFRPVFAYIDEQRRKGGFRHLKGLIYYTDGLGTYPSEAPPYTAAFVFSREDLVREQDVPAWVLKVYPDWEEQEKR